MGMLKAITLLITATSMTGCMIVVDETPHTDDPVYIPPQSPYEFNQANAIDIAADVLMLADLAYLPVEMAYQSAYIGNGEFDRAKALATAPPILAIPEEEFIFANQDINAVCNGDLYADVLDGSSFTSGNIEAGSYDISLIADHCYTYDNRTTSNGNLRLIADWEKNTITNDMRLYAGTIDGHWQGVLNNYDQWSVNNFVGNVTHNQYDSYDLNYRADIYRKQGSFATDLTISTTRNLTWHENDLYPSAGRVLITNALNDYITIDIYNNQIQINVDGYYTVYTDWDTINTASKSKVLM